MTAKTKTQTKTNARLTKELLETAKGMHASGIMDDAAYEKITIRHLKRTADDSAAAPVTGDDNPRHSRASAHEPGGFCAPSKPDGRLRFPIGARSQTADRCGARAA
jgi:hypothetical protein